jgi:O-methyltransferase
MKSALYWLEERISAQAPLRKFIRRLVLPAARLSFPAPLKGPFGNLTNLADFSRWIKSHPCPSQFPDRYAVYDHVLRTEAVDGPIDYLEFGVREGLSLRWWVEHLVAPEARFFGFDCFEGLPEAWGIAPAGSFSTGGQPPKIDDPRVNFVVGYFQDTLGDFLRAYSPAKRRIINMDADLYSSTLFVLTTLAPFLKSGDVLIFDELGSILRAHHEFRAFRDFCSAFRVSAIPVGADEALHTIAVKIA